MKFSSMVSQQIHKWFYVAIIALGFLHSQSANASVFFDGIDPSANSEQVNTSDQHYLLYVRHMTVPVASQMGEVWTLGNDITGKTPEQLAQIVSDIKALENPIQKQIFERMRQSSEQFAFNSTSHARNVVLQRMETMRMMTKLDTGVYGYARDHDGVVSTSASDYWMTGKDFDFYFRQHSGTAYQAINALCADGAETYGECLGAMYACIWWGASQAVGENTFNSTYPGAMALNMGKTAAGDTHGTAPVRPYMWVATDQTTIIPGDRVYFKNYNYGVFVNRHHKDDEGNWHADPRIDAFWWPGWDIEVTPEGRRIKKNPTKPALLGRDDEIYLLQGENAFYMGEEDGSEIYHGLGLAETKDDMKTALQDSYN